MGGIDHILGIGGVGMSALAQALLDAGHRVSGADRFFDQGGTTPVLEALRRQGVKLCPESSDAITPEISRVIVSTAIEKDHPSLLRAQALGIPVVHRAVALSDLLSGDETPPRRLVAVVGTCGKSTVTAILGHLLTECGLDPVVVNGAQVVGWDRQSARVGSVRAGGKKWAVAEVDESDKSLTAFNPYAAIVTNASADHYSEEEMNAVFDAFIHRLPGPVVDGRGIFGVPDAAKGLTELDELAATCPLPGAHNRANALLALMMALSLGCELNPLAAALKTFPGVERRLQRVGDLAGCAVFDDYAHNPEKLAAMWRTLASAYPQGIAVVWRPHGYGPLRKMLAPLAAMFRCELRPCDRLLVLPVYDAGGTADRSVNSDALASSVPGAEYVRDLTEAEAHLRTLAPAVGAIVTAGARDPGLPVLARRLAGKE